MAWLQRRSKLRRVSADRSRPVPKKPTRALTPPGKRTGRYLLTILFLIGSILILAFRPTAPQPHAGELATRDYRARVTFTVIDHEATNRALYTAQTRCPRIFREKRADIEKLRRDELPRLLLLALNVRARDIQTETLASWGLTEQKFQRLKEGLDQAWVDGALPVINAAIEKVAERGIMDSSVRQQERSSERYEIIIRDDLESPPKETRRNTRDIIEYPSELQQILVEELAPVLRDRPAAFQDAVIALLKHRATPTLKLDEGATKEAVRLARENVETVYRTIAKDSVILAADDRVTPETLREIKAEQSAYEKTVGAGPREKRFLGRPLVSGAGIAGLFLIGFALLAACARYVTTDIFASNTRVGTFYLISLAIFGAVRTLEHLDFSLQWSPVILAAMVFAVTMGPLMAFGSIVLICGLVGIVTNGGLALVMPLMLAGAVTIFRLIRLRRRTHVFETGLAAGMVQCAAVWAMWAAGLIHAAPGGPLPAQPVMESIAALCSGALAGVVLTVALPYVEKVFDVATDLRLLEWTDQNQPLLRKLALEAPGTYHHSTVVSNMAEVAAEAIGANALLARVGGYLHDVGKIGRPEYFVENTTGQPSRHNDLSPMMSGLILTAHTKDGVELAAAYGVPSPIRRIIAQHHGTSVVEFFYNKALKEAQQAGGTIQEDAFRYRSPKPQSAEAAIVLLADSAESAARSLDNASSAKIERLVHDIVERRLKDGQLDDCRMNITDIRLVEKSLVRSLTAISHPRIHYPTA